MRRAPGGRAVLRTEFFGAKPLRMTGADGRGPRVTFRLSLTLRMTGICGVRRADGRDSSACGLRMTEWGG